MGREGGSMRFTTRSTEKYVRRCTQFSPILERGHLGSLRPATHTQDREMTFKHKLSKRLAIIWGSAAVLTALVVFACSGGEQIIAPNKASSITVAPNQPTVRIQDVTKPGTVTDLAPAGVTDSSVSLSFTEVSNGLGLPASYAVR